MSNKTIVFDGQVFQSAAWDRGMGKYSLSLLEALLKDKQYDYTKTFIVFTKNLELDAAAKAAIQQAAPGAELVFLDLKVPNIHDHRSIESIMRQNKVTLGGFITEHTADTGVDFVILSLFIDQVCSVFPAYARKVLLFYDLIPLQYSERYGLFHSYENYLRRFKIILEADRIWTISQTVADDLMVYAGIDRRKLTNINGAPIPRAQQNAQQPRSIEMPKRFLLMPSGNDLRKNNERAIDGLATYNHQNPEAPLTLLVTSHFDEDTRSDLRKRSKDVQFTGNVSEGELLWLYQNAAGILFVPEYEGLGLPILEAIEVNKPIICSNLTVFNEMSPTAFYYANQFSPASIAEAIKRAMTSGDFSKKKKEYPKILRRYTWENSAKDALRSLGGVSEVSKTEKTKQRIAVFLPDPAGYSAIGKFNMHLHPALSEYFDIDYYVEKGVGGRPLVRPSYLPAVASVKDARTFGIKSYRKYAGVLYHVGNSEFHLETIKNALYLPGVAIMHDINLGGVFDGDLVGRGYISKDRLKAEQRLNELSGVKSTSYTTSIASAQLALIAHSEFSAKSLRAVTPKDVPVYRANLPVATPQLRKNKIGGRMTIGFAGIIHPAKGLKVLDDIQLSGLFDEVDIYIFGIPLIDEAELQRIGAMHNVTIVTDLTDFQFQSRLADVDILVNYRPDYNGEASASTLEAMRLGVVPIVRRIGWYDELPDDAVVKVDDITDIVPALHELCYDDELRQSKSEKSRLTTAKDFTYEKYAKTIHEYITKSQAATGLNGKVAVALRAGSSKEEIRHIIG